MEEPILRIGYLIQQFPPEVGAGSARALEMASRWLSAGAEVFVFTGMPNRPEGRIRKEYRGRLYMSEAWDGVQVHRSWLYARPESSFVRTVANNVSFMATSAISGMIRAGRLDVLIASSPPFFPHLSGAFIAAAHRVPLVLEIRDLWPDYLVGMGTLREGSAAARGLFALERIILRRASAVAVVTESFRRRVRDKDVDDSRIEVLPNGVDTANYFRDPDVSPPLPTLVREPGDQVVGYLGNMGKGQGLESILIAAAQLQEIAPRVRFVFAGDGPMRARLEEMRAELRLKHLTLHSPIPKSKTRAFYNACDLLLVPLAPIPIFQETVPSKIFEILACERPVLLSAAGEAQQIIERSGGGWIAKPGDSTAIAGGILEALASPEGVRRTMGARGRAFVKANYDRATIADRYLTLLRRVAGAM